MKYQNPQLKKTKKHLIIFLKLFLFYLYLFDQITFSVNPLYMAGDYEHIDILLIYLISKNKNFYI